MGGSKIGESVGAAGFIFVNGNLVYQPKFKQHEHRSNNQGVKIAISKTLENLKKIHRQENNIGSIAKQI